MTGTQSTDRNRVNVFTFKPNVSRLLCPSSSSRKSRLSIVMDPFDQPKPRVNGSMLPRFQGSIVCLLGQLKNVDPSGSSLTMTLSDGVDAQVNLQTPLDRPIEGLIEVVGQVGANPRQITGLHLISHGEKDFDMALYEEVLKITHEFPQYYRLGGPQN